MRIKTGVLMTARISVYQHKGIVQGMFHIWYDISQVDSFPGVTRYVIVLRYCLKSLWPPSAPIHFSL